MAQVLPRKGFRVKVRATNEWVIGTDGVSELTSKDRNKAIIFQPSERKHWAGYEEFEIVDIQEDEIMATLGEEVAPRLPGF